MAKPGGWNENGTQFNDADNELHFFILGSEHAEELPLDAVSSVDPLISAEVEAAKIQLFESRDEPNPPKVLSAGVRAPKHFVETVCNSWGMPPEVFAKVHKAGALAWFLLQPEEAQSHDPTHPSLQALDVCFRWGLGHDSFVIMFGRYDIRTSTLKAFVSSRTVLGDASVIQILNSHAHELRNQPLKLVGLLMGLCESYVDADAQGQNRKNLEIAGALGLQNARWLEGWHIQPNNSTDKSKAIYAAYDSTSWLNKGCEELISIGREYLTLAKDVEARYEMALPRQEVQDVVHRAELDTYMLQYLERMVKSQSDSYNNLLATSLARANAEDARSMKTISYVTLVFFPITFVSAIFSTTVFDFQQWGSTEHSGVISPGWWLFVLSCALVTVLTFALWWLWQWTRKQRVRRSSRNLDPEMGLEMGRLYYTS